MEEIEIIVIGKGKRFKLTNITLDEFQTTMKKAGGFYYKPYKKGESAYQNIEVHDYKEILKKRKKKK